MCVLGKVDFCLHLLPFICLFQDDVSTNIVRYSKKNLLNKSFPSGYICFSVQKYLLHILYIIYMIFVFMNPLLCNLIFNKILILCLLLYFHFWSKLLILRQDRGENPSFSSFLTLLFFFLDSLTVDPLLTLFENDELNCWNADLIFIKSRKLISSSTSHHYCFYFSSIKVARTRGNFYWKPYSDI